MSHDAQPSPTASNTARSDRAPQAHRATRQASPAAAWWPTSADGVPPMYLASTPDKTCAATGCRPATINPASDSAESSAMFCRMLIHRPAWPFVIPQTLNALYRLRAQRQYAYVDEPCRLRAPVTIWIVMRWWGTDRSFRIGGWADTGRCTPCATSDVSECVHMNG
jgi:hypothetical protein